MAQPGYRTFCESDAYVRRNRRLTRINSNNARAMPLTKPAHSRQRFAGA
jgi:ribosomal protein L36